MTAGGNLDDPMLWISHYGGSVPGTADIAPMFVADVDGLGTPGFGKTLDGANFMYNYQPATIVDGRVYRISADIFRSGPITVSYWSWRKNAILRVLRKPNLMA